MTAAVRYSILSCKVHTALTAVIEITAGLQVLTLSNLTGHADSIYRYCISLHIGHTHQSCTHNLGLPGNIQNLLSIDLHYIPVPPPPQISRTPWFRLID